MSKDKSKKETVRAITKESFEEIIDGLKDYRGDKDKAVMALAERYKDGEQKGLNTKAAKMCLQVERMSPVDRAAFLREFDKYRKWMKLDAQTGLRLGDDDEAGEEARPN